MLVFLILYSSKPTSVMCIRQRRLAAISTAGMLITPLFIMLFAIMCDKGSVSHHALCHMQVDTGIFRAMTRALLMKSCLSITACGTDIAHL